MPGGLARGSLLTRYTPINTKIIAVNFIKVRWSFPVIIAKMIPIKGCKYIKTPTVEAFNWVRAKTLNK
jgi:hypothetical protein